MVDAIALGTKAILFVVVFVARDTLICMYVFDVIHTSCLVSDRRGDWTS